MDKDQGNPKEDLITESVLRESLENKLVDQEDKFKVNDLIYDNFKTWFNTNIERIKGSSTRLGKKDTSSDKTLFGNYLKYSRFHNLDIYKHTEFLKNLLKILKLFKDLKHEEIRIGRSPAVSNIRLKEK